MIEWNGVIEEPVYTFRLSFKCSGNIYPIEAAGTRHTLANWCERAINLNSYPTMDFFYKRLSLMN